MGFCKVRNKKVKCRYCGKEFLSADVKANYCPDCQRSEHPCQCGCGGVVVGAHRRYLFTHAPKDSKNLAVKEGHRNQALKMTGSQNPSKRPDVREKISQALLGRCIWKEGKSEDEVITTRERIVAGTMKAGASRHSKKYLAQDGLKYRSSLEVKVADFLYGVGIPYFYEKPLRLKDKRTVYPDFTILGHSSSEGLGCIIEVSGAAFERWRFGIKSKIVKMRDSYWNVPIIVITYGDKFPYIRDLATIRLVRVFTVNAAVSVPEDKALIVESDHFNFDYSHFLPWHRGKCADFHGHSSKITVAVKGYPDQKGMVVDFSEVKRVVKEVLDSVDHKVFVPSYTVKKKARTSVRIEFQSKGRRHLLVLPRTEVCILPGEQDSTIENISHMLGVQVLDRLPMNVHTVAITANEGIGKAAQSTVSLVTRPEGISSYALDERTGDIKDVIAFYQRTPFLDWRRPHSFTPKPGMFRRDM